MFKRFAAIVLLLTLLLSLAIWQRYRVLIPLSTTGEPVPQVQEAVPVPGGLVFAQDAHFTIVQLDAQTYAIAEPYSWARNVNYLILGDQRALLFDAGVGHYDIRPVVRSITDLPLTFMPSHFHYDHTGQGDWPNLALVDLPHVRDRAVNDRVSPTWGEHLGSSEAISLPTWEVSEWVKPNTTIDLGGRSLLLLYTPGHTNNSVSLFDTEREIMFTGDFYSGSGSLSSFLPTSRLGDYLQSAEKVLRRTQQLQDLVLRGAHAPPANTIPFGSREDIQILRNRLLAIREGSLTGEGTYPVTYSIKTDLVLSAEPGFLQDWEPTYPMEHWVNDISE